MAANPTSILDDLPFLGTGKNKRAAKANLPAKKGPTLEELHAEEIGRLKVQLSAMQQQRDFWTEQARTLQNHLQIVLRGQADILAQMAHSAVCPDDVHAAIAAMGEELRQPLTTVAAVEALAASCRSGTQGGQYTMTNERNRMKIEGQGHER